MKFIQFIQKNELSLEFMILLSPAILQHLLAFAIYFSLDLNLIRIIITNNLLR